MYKRIIAMMLTLATLLGMLAVPASAASTLEEAMAEVDIYAKGEELVYLTIAVNGYCQRQSNLFADRITRFLFVRGATVEVHVGYMTNDGVLVPTNDTVTVTIDNPQWDSPNMRYVSNSGSVQNGSYCHVSLEVPKIRGVDAKYNFVYTTIVSQNYGTLVDYVQMALLDKYDNGELSKPCRHNGACGLL